MTVHLTGPGAPVPRLRVIVVVKAFHRAKSRFTGIDPGLRHRLVWSMLLDSIIPVAPMADEVVVVSGEPGLRGRLRSVGVDATVVADPGELNAAVRAGEQAVIGDGSSGRTTLVMTADLPALRTDEIAGILTTACGSSRAFVADHTGAGTTMLVSATALEPAFGPASAERHRRSGAIALPGHWPGARLDVDDRASLHRALDLGVGHHTAALLDGDPSLLRPPA